MTSTRIVLAGGEVWVKGAPDSVHDALTAAGAGRAQLEDQFGSRIYVNPCQVLYLEEDSGEVGIRSWLKPAE